MPDGGSNNGGGGPPSVATEAAEGWVPAPGAAPGSNMYVPQASWDTSVWGNYGTPTVDPVTGNVTFNWKPGSQSFSIDPAFAGDSLVNNWLTWPGSGGNVPVLGTAGMTGGPGQVVTDATSPASSTYWRQTRPGVFAPTNAGMQYASEQQAQYEAGQAGAMRFVEPVLGLGAGLLAGPALAGIAGSLLGGGSTIAGTDLTTAALSGQLGAGATGGLGTISSAAPSLLSQAYGLYQGAKPYLNAAQDVMKLQQVLTPPAQPPPQQAASLLR